MPPKKETDLQANPDQSALASGVDPKPAEPVKSMPIAGSDTPQPKQEAQEVIPPEKLATSANANQPNAAYLPTGEASPTPAPAGEPGIMPEGGQGQPYKEGELEEVLKKDPGPAAELEAAQKAEQNPQG